jgi:hypothetical protein
VRPQRLGGLDRQHIGQVVVLEPGAGGRRCRRPHRRSPTPPAHPRPRPAPTWPGRAAAWSQSRPGRARAPRCGGPGRWPIPWAGTAPGPPAPGPWGWRRPEGRRPGSSRSDRPCPSTGAAPRRTCRPSCGGPRSSTRSPAWPTPRPARPARRRPPRPVGDRERAALRPGRDLGRGRLPGAHRDRPHVMACLGNLVIGTLSRAGPVNLAAALRFHSRDPPPPARHPRDQPRMRPTPPNNPGALGLFSPGGARPAALNRCCGWPFRSSRLLPSRPRWAHRAPAAP